jgi:prepilin-type N-terminal cleavage/methylation domain-containing protein
MMNSRSIRRRGFTLVELMIVVVIGALLASMLIASVIRALLKGKETRNRVDITQLEVALEQFKQRFGAYPPSRIKLCEKYFYYDLTANQLDIDSVAFLTKMFPRIDMSIWNSSIPGVGIDWNGNGFIDGTFPGFVPGEDAPGAITLEGDQCLVFFLGGIPQTSTVPDCLGFAADPKNPANPLATDRIGPFYEFQGSRLVALRLSGNAFNTYYSYVDTFSSTNGQGQLVAGAPYAYFSSYKSRNGYNRYAPLTQPVYPISNALPFSASDCNIGGLGVVSGAYFQSTSPGAGNQYFKPTSFQIVSAGFDNTFGPGGGPWTPQTASSFYPQNSSGYDDQANFTSGMLGVGAN